MEKMVLGRCFRIFARIQTQRFTFEPAIKAKTGNSSLENIRGYISVSPFPFSFCFNGREHLKVTTLLASSIISSPVNGFLPLRSFLPFTQNFPKPLIRMSSPFASVAFMISKRDPTSSKDLDLGNPSPLRIESVRWALVRVMGCNSIY